ncbi:helix-turn-helix domain-containing protein [Methanolobus halotolerans]|uniref:Transcriptional regulator n=1 Tax=Methanolobus halotolerans TaxID=2052935 RepID=A0A4E0Q804_9EURY|nr:helix-turn-helix domain-containing protein [Methanolobus halotolerans]TGC10976.1 transcriptional regulator [Methanolobus halotolerans]
MSEKELLEEILENLQQMNEKLDSFIGKKETAPDQSKKGNIAESLDIMTLLSLPDHLRTTATTLFEIGPATAEEVSKVTLKERAVESNYLNQLVRMEHVEKYREGRKVYFRINEK